MSQMSSATEAEERHDTLHADMSIPCSPTPLHTTVTPIALCATIVPETDDITICCKYSTLYRGYFTSATSSCKATPRSRSLKTMARYQLLLAIDS